MAVIGGRRCPCTVYRGFSQICCAGFVYPGVFCNSAITAAENDTELLVQSTVQMRKELRDHVVSLFHSIDERGLGRVTITDFEKAFDTEAMQAGPNLRASFRFQCFALIPMSCGGKVSS